MKDYIYIRAWGRLVSSYKYYVDEQIEQARKDNAPQNAIYKSTIFENGWQTVDDITSETTKRDLKNAVASLS